MEPIDVRELAIAIKVRVEGELGAACGRFKITEDKREVILMYERTIKGEDYECGVVLNKGRDYGQFDCLAMFSKMLIDGHHRLDERAKGDSDGA
jgi:hypothetical protein